MQELRVDDDEVRNAMPAPTPEVAEGQDQPAKKGGKKRKGGKSKYAAWAPSKFRGRISSRLTNRIVRSFTAAMVERKPRDVPDPAEDDLGESYVAATYYLLGMKPEDTKQWDHPVAVAVGRTGSYSHRVTSAGHKSGIEWDAVLRGAWNKVRGKSEEGQGGA